MNTDKKETGHTRSEISKHYVGCGIRGKLSMATQYRRNASMIRAHPCDPWSNSSLRTYSRKSLLL